MSNQCVVCAGTGWMAYPHPDDDGGLNGAAVQVCPNCVTDDLCPRCGEGLINSGAIKVCVACGFIFDEADEPDAVKMLYGG